MSEVCDAGRREVKAVGTRDSVWLIEQPILKERKALFWLILRHRRTRYIERLTQRSEENQGRVGVPAHDGIPIRATGCGELVRTRNGLLHWRLLPYRASSSEEAEFTRRYGLRTR